MTILTNADFNVVVTNSNGEFVRISELNKMIQYGAINIDEKKNGYISQLVHLEKMYGIGLKILLIYQLRNLCMGEMNNEKSETLYR